MSIAKKEEQLSGGEEDNTCSVTLPELEEEKSPDSKQRSDKKESDADKVDIKQELQSPNTKLYNKFVDEKYVSKI